MVQIIPAQPSPGEMLAKGLASGIAGGGDLLTKLLLGREQAKQKGALAEKQFARELMKLEKGEELRGEREEKLARLQSQLKASGDLDLNEENYGIVEKSFGKNFADMWKAAPVGGKTELVRLGIESKMRGLDLESLLQNIPKSELPQQEEQFSERLDTPQGFIDEKEGVKFPDYKLDTSGMVPKDIVSYRSSLRKENTKPFQDATTKNKSLQKELASINSLRKLNQSKDLPTGLGSQLKQGINPKTGKIVLPSLASPATQVFEKTINDFTTRAKETFGARVTNFELERFMARLPRLTNTREGRAAIIDQMEIMTKIDHLYSKALTDVYNHYKLGDITPEDAERIAEEQIRGEVDRLVDRYENIDNKLDSLSLRKKKTHVKGVKMRAPDGSERDVPREQVNRALEANYELI